MSLYYVKVSLKLRADAALTPIYVQYCVFSIVIFLVSCSKAWYAERKVTYSGYSPYPLRRYTE